MSGTSDYSEELYAYLDVFFGELAMRLRYTLAGSPYELLVIEIDVFQEYCPSSLSIAALTRANSELEEIDYGIRGNKKLILCTARC